MLAGRGSVQVPGGLPPAADLLPAAGGVGGDSAPPPHHTPQPQSRQPSQPAITTTLVLQKVPSEGS